jgi:hypothetical protein
LSSGRRIWPGLASRQSLPNANFLPFIDCGPEE